jgi:hypothetical protein
MNVQGIPAGGLKTVGQIVGTNDLKQIYFALVCRVYSLSESSILLLSFQEFLSRYRISEELIWNAC